MPLRDFFHGYPSSEENDGGTLINGRYFKPSQLDARGKTARDVLVFFEKPSNADW